MTKSGSDRRHHIRYFPDTDEVALISLGGKEFDRFENENYCFQGNIAALILDISYGGCNLALIDHQPEKKILPIGFRTVVKAGKLDPLQAEVKWRVELTDNMLKVGFEFMDTKIF